MSRPLAVGFDYPLPAPGAALRRGHWSTEGLKVLLLPNTGSPTVSVYDYARDLWTPHVGSTLANGNTPTAHGLMKFTSTDAGIEVAADSRTVIPTTRITILLVERKTDLTLRLSTAFGIDTAIQAGFCEAYLPHSNGSTYFDFGGIGFTNIISTSAVPLTTEPTVWAFIAGRELRMYRNGVLIASGGSASYDVPLSQQAVPFLLNNGANGGTNTGGLSEVSFFSVLDAEWNASQVAAWTARQDLMFERPHVELFDVASAGAFLAHRALRSNVAVQRSYRW